MNFRCSNVSTSYMSVYEPVRWHALGTRCARTSDSIPELLHAECTFSRTYTNKVRSWSVADNHKKILPYVPYVPLPKSLFRCERTTTECEGGTFSVQLLIRIGYWGFLSHYFIGLLLAFILRLHHHHHHHYVNTMILSTASLLSWLLTASTVAVASSFVVPTPTGTAELLLRRTSTPATSSTSTTQLGAGVVLESVTGRSQLDPAVIAKYNALPYPEDTILAEYVWVDAEGSTRSKTRTLPKSKVRPVMC